MSLTQAATVATLARVLAHVASTDDWPAPHHGALAPALQAAAQHQVALVLPRAAGRRTDALVFALAAHARAALRAEARGDVPSLRSFARARTPELCCDVGRVAAKRAGAATRDGRVLALVVRSCVSAVRALVETASREFLDEFAPFARSVLEKKDNDADDVALNGCRRDVLCTLWRVVVQSEFERDPELARCPTGLALAMDRLAFSQYGARHTLADSQSPHSTNGLLAAECASMLLWLVCHSPRHRKRLEKIHGRAGELVYAPFAGLNADRNGGVARVALFAVQWVSSRKPARRVALAARCAETLGQLVEGDRGDVFRDMALHALLNLSVASDATTVVAERLLDPLVDVATAPPGSVDVETRELACSVLGNLARDPNMRFLAYRSRLDAGFTPTGLQKKVKPRRASLVTRRQTVDSPEVLRKAAAAGHVAKRRAAVDATKRRAVDTVQTRYRRWLAGTFPADERPRLETKPPPKPPRPLSASYKARPGEASTQWAKAPEALWSPQPEPERDASRFGEGILSAATPRLLRAAATPRRRVVRGDALALRAFDGVAGSRDGPPRRRRASRDGRPRPRKSLRQVLLRAVDDGRVWGAAQVRARPAEAGSGGPRHHDESEAGVAPHRARRAARLGDGGGRRGPLGASAPRGDGGPLARDVGRRRRDAHRRRFRETLRRGPRRRGQRVSFFRPGNAPELGRSKKARLAPLRL